MWNIENVNFSSKRNSQIPHTDPKKENVSVNCFFYLYWIRDIYNTIYALDFWRRSTFFSGAAHFSKISLRFVESYVKILDNFRDGSSSIIAWRCVLMFWPKNAGLRAKFAFTGDWRRAHWPAGRGTRGCGSGCIIPLAASEYDWGHPFMSVGGKGCVSNVGLLEKGKIRTGIIWNQVVWRACNLWPWGGCG